MIKLTIYCKGQGAPITISVVIPNVKANWKKYANLSKLVDNYVNLCI